MIVTGLLYAAYPFFGGFLLGLPAIFVLIFAFIAKKHILLKIILAMLSVFIVFWAFSPFLISTKYIDQIPSPKGNKILRLESIDGGTTTAEMRFYVVDTALINQALSIRQQIVDYNDVDWAGVDPAPIKWINDNLIQIGDKQYVVN